jgi:3-methyladenine DNA glycosylase AlkD
MEFKEVMKELKALGTAQNRKIYKRHGAGENLFGVSYANLNKLKKKIKTDTALAKQLWSSGNVDARTLATMIADPKQIKKDLLELWVKDIKYYALVDSFVRNLVSKTNYAKSLMEK